ncbi:MAG TPA: DUF455 family protein [Pyrinomonadaceae bacterium]
MKRESVAEEDVSARDIAPIARTLAVIELHRARQLARRLPETSNFESHFKLALAIGAAGRRIELLIPAFLDPARMSDDIAPTPGWPVDLNGDSSSNPTYTTFYQYLKRLLASFEYRTYDLCLRLDACLTLDSVTDYEVCIPQRGESGFNLSRLVKEVHAARESMFTEARRVRRGPSRHENDPRWMLRSADEFLPRMPSVEEKDGLLQKLHNTALRETVASEVAALNLLEYDGLPWSFYLDMARQCEDEARHAIMTANALRARGKEIGDYPVSYLGNFYEMFWEMTLEERLVAMNLDIEAVGQGYLAGVARRLKGIDEDAAQLYDFISVDERRHARIGIHWLGYLYPDPEQRRTVTEACRWLLLVNLASAHTAVMGGTVCDALDIWATSGSPFRFDEARSMKHEQEITPLLARRAKSHPIL